MRLHETTSPFENEQKYEKDFVKWWRDHLVPKTSTIPTVSDEELYSKFSITGNEKGLLFINSGWNLVIEDNTITRLPFRFGEVNQMRLSAKNLTTLEGAPRYCNMFALERLSGIANDGLDNILNGPERVQHMSIELTRPLTSLANNLKTPIETMWIHAPSITSFEGLNVYCQELTLNLPQQKSISGIHKQLKNVDRLALILDQQFDGGLLSLAMIKGLKGIFGSNDPNPPLYQKAYAIINDGIASHWNVHELQENLIDAGLGKFARL